jgi:hypothetical protein
VNRLCISFGPLKIEYQNLLLLAFYRSSEPFETLINALLYTGRFFYILEALTTVSSIKKAPFRIH